MDEAQKKFLVEKMQAGRAKALKERMMALKEEADKLGISIDALRKIKSREKKEAKARLERQRKQEPSTPTSRKIGKAENSEIFVAGQNIAAARGLADKLIPDHITTWTPSEKMKCIDLYVVGHTMDEISAVVGHPVKECRKLINTYQRSITQAKVTRMMPQMQKKDGTPVKHTKSHQKEFDTLLNPELINEEFFKMLSPPDGDSLTEAEVRFCWAYVASLDLEEAIFAAGLDAGLYEVHKVAANGSPMAIKGFDACIKMRIAFLKMKPNLAAFIKKIRAEAVFNVGVDKDFLQKEIMCQIESLKLSNSLEAKKLLRDYIMMLGRTFGGFVDKVEIGEVDHAKTIEKLMKAAKGGEGKKLANEAARARKALEEAAREREEESAAEQQIVKGTDQVVQ